MPVVGAFVMPHGCLCLDPARQPLVPGLDGLHSNMVRPFSFSHYYLLTDTQSLSGVIQYRLYR
jgi:hypothetical protein